MIFHFFYLKLLDHCFSLSQFVLPGRATFYRRLVRRSYTRVHNGSKLIFSILAYADIGLFSKITRRVVPPLVTEPVPTVQVEQTSVRPVPEVAHLPSYPTNIYLRVQGEGSPCIPSKNNT